MGVEFLTSNSRLCRNGELPIYPSGERVIFLPHRPVEKSEAGLIIPESAQHRPYSGKLVAAGLKALDLLHDQAIEVGDTVFWAKFAGVIEEWDRIAEGEFVCPHGEHSWQRLPKPDALSSAFKCGLCGAKRMVEAIIVADASDVLGSAEQAQRLYEGKIRIVKRQTDEGLQHFFEYVTEGK